MDLLVTEDGEALLERELEPVAARDPVPSPVVKVLVRNNSLDPLEVRVRRCPRWRDGVSINAHSALFRMTIQTGQTFEHVCP